MTDLNVTKGEWRVEELDVSGNTTYEIVTNERDVASYLVGIRNKNDAHLFAQAKNMYEKLERVSSVIVHDISNFEPALFNLTEEIKELLNACKPPEE